MIKKIIKIGTKWCGPCKSLSPIFDKVSKNSSFDDIEFDVIDAEENADFSEKYEIRTVPTILFMDENDNEVKRSMGSMTEKQLIDLINAIKKLEAEK